MFMSFCLKAHTPPKTENLPLAFLLFLINNTALGKATSRDTDNLCFYFIKEPRKKCLFKKDVICSDRDRIQVHGRVPEDMEEENRVKDTDCTGKPEARSMKNRLIFFYTGIIKSSTALHQELFDLQRYHHLKQTKCIMSPCHHYANKAMG